MALNKIELKLGKKVISLTPEQFEELKRDMRELDKRHHYYWHTSPWYDQWYYNQPVTVPLTFTTSAGSYQTANSGVGSSDCVSTTQTPSPPVFNGSILSTS